MKFKTSSIPKKSSGISQLVSCDSHSERSAHGKKAHTEKSALG